MKTVSRLKSAVRRLGLLAAGAVLLGTSLCPVQRSEAAATLGTGGGGGGGTVTRVFVTSTVYYVSPSGDNTTGLSWQHAFSDFNKIQWGLMHSGDQISIDGGEGNWNSPVNYYHSLVVPAGAPAINISLSSEPFHNGAARIYAPSGATSLTAGININSSNPVSISGGTAYGLQLANFPIGVLVQRGSATLDALQIIGASQAGTPPPSPVQSSGIFVTGGANVTVTRTAAFGYRYSAVCRGRSALNISRSWLYNYSWPGAGQLAGGVFNNSGASNVTVAGCVLGPGLNCGVANAWVPGLVPEVAAPSSSSTTVTNCLLIQPAESGLANSSFTTMTASNITEFKTSKNPYGAIGNCLYSINPSSSGMQVNSSVVCGGIVRVPAFTHPITANNIQFNTGGNTRFLSSSESNPHFLTVDPNMANPTNITQWINMDFSNTAYQYTGVMEGSSFNSINQLLSNWAYTAVHPL